MKKKWITHTGLWVSCGVTENCGFTVRVRVKPAMGTGFAGTGAGWTSHTHPVPMCHPNDRCTVQCGAYPVQMSSIKS